MAEKTFQHSRHYGAAVQCCEQKTFFREDFTHCHQELKERASLQRPRAAIPALTFTKPSAFTLSAMPGFADTLCPSCKFPGAGFWVFSISALTNPHIRSHYTEQHATQALLTYMKIVSGASSSFSPYVCFLTRSSMPTPHRQLTTS